MLSGWARLWQASGREGRRGWGGAGRWGEGARGRRRGVFREDEAPVEIGITLRKNSTKHVITEIEGGQFNGRKGPTQADEQKTIEEFITKEIEARSKKIEEKYKAQADEAIAKANATEKPT